MVLDGEQDESFLVLDEERLFFLLPLGMFLVLLSRVFDDVFLPNGNGRVFLSSTCTREFLLEARDRVSVVFAEVHFGEGVRSLQAEHVSGFVYGRVGPATFFEGVRSREDAMSNEMRGNAAAAMTGVRVMGFFVSNGRCSKQSDGWSWSWCCCRSSEREREGGSPFYTPAF